MFAWKLCTLAAATALWAATTARADDGQVIVVGSAQIEVAPADASAGVGKALVNDVASRHGVTPEQRDYRLGLLASRPSAALRAQLKLPKDQGLLVEALQADGPAAKAGVQQYDILLTGNKKPLSDVGDLVRLIHEVKDGKLTLELLRAGKQESVTVTPVKMPENESGALRINPEEAASGVLSLNFGPNVTEGGPLEFHIVHPGQILPPGSPMPGSPGSALAMEITVHATSKLADGSKVEITRHGAEPAKVVVTRDKEKWEGTSNDLSKIPEKIRPEVEKLLHPAFDHMRILGTTGGPADGNALYFGGPAGLPGLLHHPMISPDVEKRFSELQKQVDELRRSMDALQGKAKEKSAAKP